MFFVPSHDLQRPTHPRLHIRDARDAQTVLEAVRLGILQLVARRLNESERATYIRSGSVFVWEESDDDLGLKRWTDGLWWTQSRMREPFLFYEEKTPEDRKSASRNARSAGTPIRFVDSAPHQSSTVDRGRASNTTGLIKQTYSAYVTTSANARVRKWHLTAYLTYADVPNLPTIDVDPLLRTVVIPPGVYRSGKARSRQLEVENNYADNSRQVVSTASGMSLGPPFGGASNHHWASSSHAPSAAYPLAHGGYHHHSSSFAQATYPSQPAYSYPAAHAAYHQLTGHVDPRQAQADRLSEDQRVIQMLNSRHIM